MKIFHQRLALLTGVSVSALGLVSPASAATVTHPGIGHNVSGQSVTDELVISEIADEALYGVTVDETANAFAIVDSVSSGEIVQVGNAFGATPTEGYLTMTALNAGDVTIAADAQAVDATGAATARAHVERAVAQMGTASGKSSLTLQNTGDLAAEPNALATGTAAHANATLSTGILQIAAAPDADVNLDNQGTISLSAIASANASQQGAVAFASAVGIIQAARGNTSGSITLTNDGSIDIGAAASAQGFGSAVASAYVPVGIAQSASASDAAGGVASAELENSGTIAIGVAAAASARTHAVALARVTDAIHQHATGSGGGAAATMTNSGTIELTGDVTAIAQNDGSRAANAQAAVAVVGIVQDALAKTSVFFSGSTSSAYDFNHTAAPHGPASIALDNSGTIALTANAAAAGDDGAVANAAVSVAHQSAAGTDVTVTLDNSGDIVAAASANATGSKGATAAAFATGIYQGASAHMTHQALTLSSGGGHMFQSFAGVGPASVSLANTGTISLDVAAHALAEAGTASSMPGFAAATVDIGVGVNQQAFGSDASVSLTNEGTIALSGEASAVAAGAAIANARLNGFSQAAYASAFLRSGNWNGSMSSGFTGEGFVGPATVEITNSGTLDISAVAKAEGGDFANANLQASGGIEVAVGSAASILFDNSGSLHISGKAEAKGASEFANAAVNGIVQMEKGTESAKASVVNSGTISIEATVQGTALEGRATDVAGIAGIAQQPLSLATATANISNSGLISMVADAKADGATFAWAGANVLAIHQTPLFGDLRAELENEGKLNVVAIASAAADNGPAYATAHATAYVVDAGNVVADIVNNGTITAAASAVAAGNSGSVYAFAGGITMFAANHMSSTTISAGSMAGSVVNNGELNVSAKVDSANSGTAGATATGVYMMSTRNNATVVNSGLIDVEAVTEHGGPAVAYGVRAVTGFRGDPAEAGDLFTFTNDGGTIIVRQSVDGGTTWQRGTAVDVTEAPNASVINLIGDGVIYGNIAVQDGDKINVNDGTTYFDGIINASFVPTVGITAAALDSGLAGVGTLNIQDGGNLVLADPRLTGPASMHDGPAYAFVDTLNVASDGTLTFELQPSAGAVQPVGSYPQVFADTAKLDGTLVADVTTASGLFADSYSWQNVIDANTRIGTFDQCLLGGPNAGSVLLTLSCSYDSQDNVDLALTRVAFNDVAGLNANGVTVGEGLECIYDVGLTGGARDMLADLFLFTDEGKYATALNMLSGSVYANYLNSFPSLGVHYDDLVDHATDCESPALAGSVLECRTGSPVHVWGQLDYQTRKADGDVQAGDSRSKRFTGLVGVDSAIGGAAILGIEGGYLTNNFRDHQFGDSVKGKGWQVGAYGVWDPGTFFLKGMTTYSALNGDSTRTVDFAGLAAGATFGGKLGGDPDVKMWTFGLHGGARLPVSASSVLTPYLNYDYVHARLDGFDEGGLEGANLTVEGSSSNHSFLTGGAKWATQIGGVVPELNLGYRYRFGDERSDFRAFFSGDSDCDFDVVSAAQKRGTVLAGLSVGGKVGPVDLRIGYEGEFNGDVTSHSGNFKLVLPIGGHKTAPPVVAPPPPPPAVAEQPVPAAEQPAPPPPPAPVERGERGR